MLQALEILLNFIGNGRLLIFALLVKEQKLITLVP